MKIGILQSAGIAGDIIEQAFNHPEFADVAQPVIYSKENQNDKNVSSDLKFGNINGIVVAPGSTTEFNFEGAMTLYTDNHVRVAAVVPDAELSEVYGMLTEDVLKQKIQKVWMSLKRDFLVSMPRIALLSLNTTLDDIEKNIMAPAVEALSEAGVGVFGPYTYDDFMAESKFQHFDAVLAMSDEQLHNFLQSVAEPTRTRLTIGLPIVMASTEYSGSTDFEAIDLEEPAEALRQAMYLVTEVCRNRVAYDEAHAHPLQKLYHERRDDSEKVRFTIPKKKE